MKVNLLCTVRVEVLCPPISTLTVAIITEALQVYWPACDVITGSRVCVTDKVILVASTMSPGPISSTVGDTARYGISVTVHCTVYESPAVTLESSGEIMTSGGGRAGEWMTCKQKRC